jgi:hypothetical protein
LTPDTDQALARCLESTPFKYTKRLFSPSATFTSALVTVPPNSANGLSSGLNVPPGFLARPAACSASMASAAPKFALAS